jgi:hypothetical protein
MIREMGVLHLRAAEILLSHTVHMSMLYDKKRMNRRLADRIRPGRFPCRQSIRCVLLNRASEVNINRGF